MTAEEMRDCIRQAAQACREKDAIAFSRLFLPDAEVVLSNGACLVGRAEIARVTAAYFERCGEIAIAIHHIVVEGNSAVVEWSWQEGTLTENAIAIDFRSGAIAAWREYRR
ncbi:nuclear transport factor 2 family protein [Oscillatoria sp. FACHB-1406]|uniref:nuclear transport factor 2 family protein n=1 Tax=Oscillatoria sp. FACHB-1406 TaxID=2692846 RepID=UPI00168831BA|nr:nuclear transport factor 2 family protein [Oscillatoria sp. FACHB-1406]MBD2577759.1 nuclear transport factor 2 family protein [Oscillatoria sp. FACHB-1406]